MSVAVSSTVPKGPIVPLPERFHINLLELVDLVISTVTWLEKQGVRSAVTPFILTLARGAIAGWTPEDAIDGFITRSANYWDQIYDRNLEFLTLNADVLFGELNMPTYIQAFKGLFTAKREDKKDGVVISVPAIAPETMDSIWNFLQAMVRISIRHIHEKREAKMVDVETEQTVAGVQVKVVEKQKRYTKDFFPDISVRKQVEKWKLTL